MNASAPLSAPPQLMLVLHHGYDGARAIDSSGHGNHGRVVRASQPGGADEQRGPGLRFDGVTTRVVVPPSASLDSLGAVRIDVQLLLEAGGHRRTIVEGFLAMACFVEPDGRFAGTIYTGRHWYGVYTKTPVVPTDRSVALSFVYDGLTTSILRVDGRTVAVAERPIGPVGGVAWPFGLNIGGWPDADRRMFQGVMYELKIWRARTRRSVPLVS